MSLMEDFRNLKLFTYYEAIVHLNEEACVQLAEEMCMNELMTPAVLLTAKRYIDSKDYESFRKIMPVNMYGVKLHYCELEEEDVRKGN